MTHTTTTIEHTDSHTRIVVPKGAVLDTRIDLPVLSPESSIDIVVESGAHATIYEGQLHELNAVVEEHGILNLITVHTQNTPREKAMQRSVRVETSGIARVFTAVLDSMEATCVGTLSGDHAVYEHFVVYYGHASETMRLHTNTVHGAQKTMSRTIVHGVATGRARMHFAGTIDIQKTGQHTDAHLEHEGLLLGTSARIEALPGFEIHTNEVKAAHSSAVHYVRPEQLFYLQARGIPETLAKQMIVGGFLNEMVAYIHEADIAQQLNTLIDERTHTIH